MNIQQDDRTVYVCQGEYRISNDPNEELSTVLGSCVSVCMWDPTVRFGGMNHFLLPTDAVGMSSRPERFGVQAMELLVNALLKVGAQRSEMRAKVFGGARISINLRDIGASNIQVAHQFLVNENIPCLAESTGGSHARRVIFRPATGQARQKLVPSVDVSDLLIMKPKQALQPPNENVTLF